MVKGMEGELFFENRVREVRKRAGMRQEDLARMAGVTRQTIIALERGRLDNPTIQTCLHIARALGRSLDDLFNLTDSPSTPPARAMKPQRSEPSVKPTVTPGVVEGDQAGVSDAPRQSLFVPPEPVPSGVPAAAPARPRRTASRHDSSRSAQAVFEFSGLDGAESDS